MAMKTVNRLSFIVLNNFFANMYVKKKFVPHLPEASPHVTGAKRRKICQRSSQSQLRQKRYRISFPMSANFVNLIGYYSILYFTNICM